MAIILPTLLCTVFADVGVSPLNDHHGEKFLYKVKAGRYLKGVLSRRFLGGEEFLIELLEYNKNK